MGFYLAFLYALSVFALFTVAISPTALAQAHNGEIYQTLVQGFFTKTQPTHTKIDERFAAWIPDHKADTSSKEYTRIGAPDISYNKLKNRQFTRSVEVSVEIKDSVRRSEILAYSDTLSLQELKLVQKTSPKEFRSEMPTLFSQTLRPVAIVAASIAGVISLFYIRSR